MSNTKLMNIPLKQIRESKVALRAVNRTSEEYLQLVDSVKNKGILNAINVREVKDKDTGELVYGLIDGLHRFTAAQDAALETIPAQVLEMSDAEVLEAQLVANVHKVETRAAEYSKHLIHILGQNPMMTMAELSKKLNKSPSWLADRLSLLKLSEPIQKLVDDNKINLSNAYALAKLDKEHQADFVDRAMTMSPAEFIPTVNARAKEIRDANRQGRDAKPDEFIPTTLLHSVKDMKSEVDNPTIGPVLLKRHNITTTLEAFTMGLKWALHLDPESIEIRKQEWEAKKKARDAERLKKQQETTAKKAKAAAEEAAKVEQQMAALSKG